MKKLIKQLLLFFLFQIVLIGIIFIFLNYLNKNQFERYKFNKDINKIVIGDSHTQLAINEKFVENTKNISQTSESFLYTFYKLQTILINNPQIDTVFFGVSYHNFSSYGDKHFFEPAIASRYFFVFPVDIQIYILRNSKSLYELMKASFISGFNNLIKTPDKYSFIYDNEDISLKIRLNNKSILKRIKSQYFENQKFCDFSTSNFDYFFKIKELCTKNKITLIILNTPLHKTYTDNVPLKFKYIFNYLTKNNKKNLIEFNDLFLEDNDFLPDGDHLTEEGAIKASKYLNIIIKVKQ